MKRIWESEEIQDIITLYTADGWTMRDIAHKYSIKVTKISEVLHSNNIAIKKVRHKNRLLNEDYFETIDSSEKAYFIGLLLTDGSIVLDPKHQRQPSLCLELVETDREIIDAFRSELNSESSLYYNKRKARKNGTFSFSVRSQKLCDDLSKYGVVPNKTQSLSSLPNVENKYEADLLRGLIDGDGSIYMSYGVWHANFCGHNREWVESVMLLANKLIGKEKRLSATLHNGVYRVCYSSRDALKLFEMLYDNSSVAIPRKRSLAIRALEDKRGKDIVCSA